MIVVSGHYKGPELRGSRIQIAISVARKIVDHERSKSSVNQFGSTPHVNAVFFVAGSLGEPDFDTVRIGPYSRKDKCVQIDIEIDKEAACAAHLRDVIVLGLHSANAAAFHFFSDKGMDFPLREAEALVRKVGEELAEFA